MRNICGMADYGCSGNNKTRDPTVRRHQRSRRHKWPHTRLQVSDVQRRVVLEELGWLLGVKRFLDRGVVERIEKLQLVQQLDHALLPLRLERHVRHGRGQAQLRLQHRRAPPSAVATCNDHAVHVAAPAAAAPLLAVRPPFSVGWATASPEEWDGGHDAF